MDPGCPGYCLDHGGVFTRGVLTRRRFLACAILVAAFGVVTADVLLGGPLTGLDHVLHGRLEGQTHGAWWRAGYGLAQAGNEYVVIPALGAVCLVAARWRRSLRPVVVTFVVCASLALVVPAIKIVTGRTAPRSGIDAVFAGGAEYPSGHAINAILLWGVTFELLVAAFPVTSRWLTRPVRRVLVTLLGAAAGAGMVMLNYHWLTDALGGWLLGTAMFILFLGLDPFGPLRDGSRHRDGFGPRGRPPTVMRRG